jgi:hypothetical protein
MPNRISSGAQGSLNLIATAESRAEWRTGQQSFLETADSKMPNCNQRSYRCSLSGVNSIASSQASFRGLRARRAALQIPPRPIGDFIHRALGFGKEGKDRIDVDGILDEAQRHIDTSFLRALG